MSYFSRWIPQNNISIFLTIQFTTIMASASHIYNGLKCIPMCSLPRLIRCSVCDSINQPPKNGCIRHKRMEYKRPYQMSVQQRKCGSRATAPRTIVACICVQRTWRHLCEYLRTAYSNHCRKSRKYSYAYPARYIEISVDCFICLHDMCGPSCDFCVTI